MTSRLPRCSRAGETASRFVLPVRASRVLVLLLLLACASVAMGQGAPPDAPTIGDAAADVNDRLAEATAELDALRQRIVDEKLPMSRKLRELESELITIRGEYQQTVRMLDRRTLDLTIVRNEIKSRREESIYLSNLLNDYIVQFGARLHIVEAPRYEAALEAAKLAPENANLSEQEVYAAQSKLLDASFDRLEEALGASRFDGAAVGPTGLLENGTFVLVGPAALFRSDDGADVGVAEQMLDSSGPTALDFGNPADAEAASALVATGEGFFPLDATLGSAHKIESTDETLVEHVKKGGPVMVPIFVMAGAALLVALLKWLGMLFVRRPSRKRIRGLLAAVAARDRAEATRLAKVVGGPTGRMLAVGVEHIEEPRSLIEEIMYETVLTTRLKLQRFLPFIAICAASAPLLGLLGTVTGIISTFKLITLFGSGDVKVLSGGISEALVTTEFGLIVAIPSLLLHAFLSRKARRLVNDMEKAAIAFANQVEIAQRGDRSLEIAAEEPVSPVASVRPPSAAAVSPAPATAEMSNGVRDEVNEQVREILTGLLAPIVKESAESAETAAAEPAVAGTRSTERD